MQILILSWRGPGHPQAGGAESATFEHAKAWAKHGDQVTLFTSFFKGCQPVEVIEGVNIIRRGEQELGVKWQAFCWYLWEEHPEFDVVVDEFHGIPFFTPLYIKVKKLAFIHEVTNNVWFLNSTPWTSSFLKATIGFYLEPLIFKLFYKKIPFMTVSASTKSDLIKWGIPSSNIHIIHNGVNTIQTKKDLKKDRRRTIIFLGALSKDKGIEDALQTFSLLSQEDRDLQFWIVGKGETVYLAKLKKMAQKLNLKEQIKFWDFVSQKKKFELLARAHLEINPSVREGWGLVVLEAAAMGTPTVGYNVAGLRDSIQDQKTGLLCEPNPQACAQVISDLLANDRLYHNLSINCVKWAQKFSWDVSTKKSQVLIKELTRQST